MSPLRSAAPLAIQDLAVEYRGTRVFSGFSLEVDKGEVVALVGPSGSGKSSVIACILGELVPASGSVRVAGRMIAGRPGRERARVRRDVIGAAHQDAALLPELNVEENVAIVDLLEGVPRSTALERARRGLSEVGLGEFAGRRVDELSGGEAQRVAMARALGRASVELLVADEPTASLDGPNALKVGNLIIDRVKSRNLGALVATHDERIAGLCDRVVDLRSVTV